MTVYLDTSAAAKLVVAEPESSDLADYLTRLDPEEALVSSALLETELRCMAVRLDLEQAVVTGLLARIDLADPDRSMFHEAGFLPGATLRTLDALHLATAVRVGVRVFVAYNRRLLDAARGVGLDVLSP